MSIRKFAIGCAAVSTLLGAASAVLVAQSAPPAESARCDSLPPPYGWATDTVVVTVRVEPDDALPRGWDELLLDGIAQYLRLPGAAGVPVYDEVARLEEGKLLVSLVITGQVSTYLDRNGVLDRPEITASTLSSEIDSSLAAAVDSLAAARVLPPLPDGAKGDRIRVRFDLSQSTSRDQRRKAISIVKQPTWLLDNFVSPLPGNPHPHYPVNAARRGIPGQVLVSFVVGPDGRVIFSTARLSKGGRYRDFQVAVLEVLPQLRFDPARVDGCPVAQLVQMPFGFTVVR